MGQGNKTRTPSATMPDANKVNASEVGALEAAYIDRRGRKGIKGRVCDFLRGRYCVVRGISDNEGANLAQLARSEEATFDVPGAVQAFESSHPALKVKLDSAVSFAAANP